MVSNCIINNSYRIISQHPCYSKEAIHKYGRLHLPVAKICNIKCNYCNIKYDCINESRPGVTSKILTPQEALSYTQKVVSSFPYIKVVGIAGPGDPLANKETFETLKLINSNFPDINLCISTNGLLLEDNIEKLLEYNLKTITVTLNSIDKIILSQIIDHISYKNKKYVGCEAASIMIEKQLNGIKNAIKNNIIVKVNTVLIPSINDKHIIKLAKHISELGVYIMNIMPLIPQEKFKHLTKPSLIEKKNIQNQCSQYIRQMTHCRQCRSDACGYL